MDSFTCCCKKWSCCSSGGFDQIRSKFWYRYDGELCITTATPSYLQMDTLCIYILQGRWSPLHVAVKNGHAAVVEVLIKFGANADAAVMVSYV